MNALHTDVTTDPLASPALRQPSAPCSSLDNFFTEYRDALIREHLPTNLIERFVLDDVARRAAQLACIDRAVASLVAQAIEALGALEHSAASDDITPHLSRVVSSEGFQSLIKISLNGSRGMHRAIGQLSDLQLQRHQSILLSGQIDPRFATEAQCLAYLVRRFRDGAQPCPRCGQRGGGSWIAVRLCWECYQCNTQSGVRVGTVMERSPLPLTKWFLAIRSVLLQPTVGATELGGLISINRVPTVREMIKKIRLAMNTGNASKLADLDQIFLAVT